MEGCRGLAAVSSTNYFMHILTGRPVSLARMVQTGMIRRPPRSTSFPTRRFRSRWSPYHFIAAARTQLGKPYVWGGGTYSGPSGIGSDGRGPGFDCSGLVLYAAYHASGGKLKLPHYSGAQLTFGQTVAWDAKQSGDLIFFFHEG